MSAIFFDTETTQLDEPEVLGWAYAKIDDFSDLSPAAPNIPISWGFCGSFKPSTFGALAVHHILPTETETLPPFEPSVLPKVDYYIGHNVDFDMKAARQEGKTICTLALARECFASCDSHTQSALMYFLTPREQWSDLRFRLRNAHDAAADVGFGLHILKRLVEVTAAKSFEELHLLSEEARVPKIMPFGKHKGLAMSKVDRGYRMWYMKQKDKDPYILEAFKRYPAET